MRVLGARIRGVPIVSHLDPRLGCTFVAWHGSVTPEEWRAHFEGLLADPEFPPGRSWLVDARRADVDLFDDAAIAEMGARMNAVAERLGGIRMAVVPNGSWQKASRLLDHEVTIERLTSIQFTSLDTACVWLGLAIEEARTIVDDLRTRAANAGDA